MREVRDKEIVKTILTNKLIFLSKKKTYIGLLQNKTNLYW